jgi:hypothetical protein
MLGSDVAHLNPHGLTVPGRVGGLPTDLKEAAAEEEHQARLSAGPPRRPSVGSGRRRTYPACSRRFTTPVMAPVVRPVMAARRLPVMSSCCRSRSRHLWSDGPRARFGHGVVEQDRGRAVSTRHRRQQRFDLRLLVPGGGLHHLNPQVDRLANGHRSWGGGDWPTAKRRTLTRLSWGIRWLVRPEVAGEPRVGRVVRAKVGSWWPEPERLEFQWFRGASIIRGATARSYRLGRADAGHHVRVRIVATRRGYEAARIRSAPSQLIRR